MYSQQIKTFIQVADMGSLTKAAENLYVTPASIMKQMNALEDRLELKLLKRTNHGVELTAAGEYLCAYAKKMIADSEEAVRKTREIQQRELKTIRVGSSFLNPSHVLADLWYKLEVLPQSTGLRLSHTMTTMIKYCLW